MAYITQAKIEALIPAPHLVDALDDDRDGQADTDLLTTIIANSDNAVDAYLSGLYDVPFDTAPAAVVEASLAFACEAIFARRLLSPDDKNPWTTRANSWRDRLQRIGNGEFPLDAATEKSFTPGAVVTDTAWVDNSLA